MRNEVKRQTAARRNATDKAEARIWKLELLALGGFCVSGFFFIASGILNGDPLTIAGSVVWLLSCMVWMANYRRFF